MSALPTADGRAEVVAAWNRRSARCGECGEVYDGAACPGCGEQPEAAPVGIIGTVSETPEGARLHLVMVDDIAGRVVRTTRLLTAEQLRWLRRQGDVRPHGPERAS